MVATALLVVKSGPPVGYRIPILLFIPLRGARRSSLRLRKPLLLLQIFGLDHRGVAKVEYIAEHLHQLIHVQHVWLKIGSAGTSVSVSNNMYEGVTIVAS